MEELSKVGNWNKLATICMQKIQQTNETSELSNFWTLRLLSLLKMRHYDLAQKEASDNINFGASESLLFLCALIPSFCGFHEDSINQLYKFKTSYPMKEKETTLAIALLLVSMGEYSRALKIFHDYGEYSHEIFKLQLLCGNISEAQKELKNIKDPRDYRVCEGLLLASQDNWTECLAVWKSLFLEFPTDSEIANNLAIALVYNGNFTEGLSLLNNFSSSFKMEFSKNDKMVSNLISLVEMISDKPADLKFKILESLSGVIDDSFDASKFS